MPARVLIVEDEKDTLEMFADLLQAQNYTVTAVSSFHEAREAVFRKPYDLVLSDLMLKTRDVDLSWRRFDELAALVKPTPVALMTGWRLPDSDIAAHGVRFALAKPFYGTDFLARIAEAVHSHALSDAHRSVVHAYFSALERRDWDAFLALCTDDVVYQLPGDAHHYVASVCGHDALRTLSEQAFRDLSDLRYEVVVTEPRPDHLTVAYRSRWRAAGQQFRAKGHVMLQMRDDAIAYIGVRLDPADISLVS